MEQLKDIAAQRAWTAEQRQAGKRIGFVPTMGALHEGHLALIKQCRESVDVVVVSIFVNPTQFDNPEDLEHYPRQMEDDLISCAGAGVDAVFVPSVEEMYPQGFCTFVEVVGPLQESLCAVSRPGHFRGVCTVVHKLFNIVQPDLAAFGQKDLQQVLFIQRMVSDMAIPTEIMVVPTVREADGLAMSSRNKRLSAESRENAVSIPRGLEKVNQAFLAGERNANKLMTIFAEEILVYENVDMDYADVVSLESLQEVEEADQMSIMAVAVFFDGVRLIDHIHLGGPSLPVALEE